MAEHVKSDDCKLYALGVLDGKEKEAIMAHLRSCADCATNVAWAHQMIALVGMASVPAMPRATVKEKVMRRIRAENAGTWFGQKPAQVADPKVKSGPETQSKIAEYETRSVEPEPIVADFRIQAGHEAQIQPDGRAPHSAVREPEPQFTGLKVEPEQEAQSGPNGHAQQSAESEPHPGDPGVEAATQIGSMPNGHEPHSAEPGLDLADLRGQAAHQTQSKPYEQPPQLTEPEPQPYKREPVSYGRSDAASDSKRGLSPILAGLALLVLAGLAAWFWKQDQTHQHQATALQAEVDQLRQKTRQKLLEPRDEDRLLAVAGTVHIVLAGTAGHGGLLYNPHAGVVVCSIALPPPPDGKKYHLWAYSWTEVPADLGVMSTTEPAWITAHMKPGFSAARFVITVEPDPGTPTASPTGARMLAGGIDE